MAVADIIRSRGLFEGSVDCNQWEEVDWRDNNHDLNAQNIVRLFTVTRSSEYRSVRLRQTGRTHSGNNHLMISGSDFVGEFFEIQPEIFQRK
jgi:hypothetical protein